MKYRLFSILALITLMLSSCAMEGLPSEDGSILAEMENYTTRTTVTDEGVFTWSNGDEVWLHTTAGGIVGTLSSGAGTSAAVFSYDGFVGDMIGKAVYPYNDGHSISGDVLNVAMPASYDLGSSLSNTNAAMFGMNLGGRLKFSHMAGVMRFKFKNVPAGVNKFTITLDKKINGTFEADLTKDYPVIETSSTSKSSEKTITLNFNALTKKSDISLYVPLPLGTYNSLELGLYDANQPVWTYSNNVINVINRKTLKLMPNVTFGGEIGGDIEDDDDITSDPNPENLTLKLTSDRNLIQTNVDEAVLTVTLGDEVITEGVTFYDGDYNVVSIPNFRFKASEVGEYVILANYGTYNSEKITIKATDLAIPASPKDPKPESTDFKAKVLITEFTTVGCAYSPSVKEIVHNLLNDPEMAEKIVVTECHSGLIGGVADPCYLHDRAFEDYCAITGFPTVKLDIDYLLKDRNGIRTVIDELVAAKESTVPGIAVNSKLENGNVVAKVTVKAAADASYRVGAFLLEDGIYAKQTNAYADWMNTHDNVIRYVDASYKAKYYGYPVADIKAGKTADIMFSWYLDDIWEYGSNKGAINGGIAWPERNDEKLHMVVYVSMSDGQGGYFVANAIDCPINGEIPFEYR